MLRVVNFLTRETPITRLFRFTVKESTPLLLFFSFISSTLESQLDLHTFYFEYTKYTMQNSKSKSLTISLHFLILISGLIFHTCATNAPTFPYQTARRWTGEHIEIFDGQTYILVHQPRLSWEQAWLACQSEGLTLARIETVEQLNFFLQLANTSNINAIGQAWVGGSRRNRSDNSYIWIETGEIVPSIMFSTGQPDRLNSTGGPEDCVEVRTSFGGANDHVEFVEKPFICTTKLEDRTTTSTSTSTSTTESVQTTEITSEMPETTTTPNPNPNPGFCTSAGLFPDPGDCQKYHLCKLNEVGDLWDCVYSCPDNLVWCQNSESCEANDVCPCDF